MADLVKVQVSDNVGTIEDNLDAVEASIREKVKEYKGIVITEDSIPDAQKLRASINKEKKSLDDDRKAIKRRWMQPYDEFDKRAREIIALYDEPIRAIDDQLNEFEENRKKLKRQEIQDIYDDAKGYLEDWLPLEKIYDSRWENKTYSGKQVREDIEKAFAQMSLSISTIKSMKSPFEEAGLSVLKNTRDLQMAIERMNYLQDMQNILEEKRRKEEEQKRLKTEQEANQKAEEANQIMQKEQAEEDPFQPLQEFPDGSDIYVVRTLMVKVPEDRLEELKEVLDSMGLSEYEVK